MSEIAMDRESVSARSPADRRRRDIAVEATGLCHRFGSREALRGIDLEIHRGEMVAFLGPNGGGKTTLFRALSTVLNPTSGTVRIFGSDSSEDVSQIRRRLGVVFQRPGLDPKLTASENLYHHGWLFGMKGRALGQRVDHVLRELRVADRSDDRVETLSGGLARRIEIARALLHEPDLLLLDEPTAGLDPRARLDLAQTLEDLRERAGVTVVYTTHGTDEADRADRVGILVGGELVSLAEPESLKKRIGGEVIVIHADRPEVVCSRAREALRLEAHIVNGTVRIAREEGYDLVPKLFALPGCEIRSIRVGRPTLEDAFIELTGRSLDGLDEVFS